MVSEGMKITYYLQAFRDLTNNSKGQALLLKLFEDYIKMLIVFNKSDKITQHIEKLLGNDEEYLKLFNDILEVVKCLKKLENIDDKLRNKK